MRALVCYSSIARFPFLAASRLVSQLALLLMWANLNSFRGLTGFAGTYWYVRRYVLTLHYIHCIGVLE